MSNAKKRPFLPRYLNEGSSGAGVDLLHAVLLMQGCDPNDELVLDSQYGPATSRAVRRLQEKLGAKPDERDGNFGPETRRRLKAQMGLDVDLAPATLFPGRTLGVTHWTGPDHEGTRAWDPLAADPV